MKVADMHCDTISEIFKSRKKKEFPPEKLRKNRLHIDLCKMRKGDYLVQNFALFVNIKEHEEAMEYCLELLDVYYDEMEKNKDIILPAKSYDDILLNHALGKMSGILTIEEGGTCKGMLSGLRNFYRLGVRMLTLTWNHINEISYPNVLTEEGIRAPFGQPNIKKGLTDFGIEFIEEMEHLGMIIDVSHLSDAGFYDVLKYTKKPFAASHSNARKVCPHVRNLTDDMVIRLSERGGVMGINFEKSFLNYQQGRDVVSAGINHVIEHIKHIRNIAGYECIGLGSDFDGIDTNEELQDAAFLPVLEEALWKAGFPQREIEGIFYKNVMRLYQEILK